MQYIQPILFALVTIISFSFAFRKFRFVFRNIKLGRDADYSDQPGERFKKMVLVALGQQKMFKRPVAALLHIVIYVSFVITQVELIEIFIDGFSNGHRTLFHLFQGSDGLVFFYNFVISFIEVLTLLTLFVTIAFLWRRNVIKLPRFTKPEMKGWPKLDGNMILVLELTLITFIFMMNGADAALHPGEYGFVVSGFLTAPLLSGLSPATLEVLEKIGWWGHIITVFAFLNYLPYSKHLHIMLAFPNTYFSRLNPQGELNDMPEITKEVKAMMDPNAAYAPAPEGEAAPQKFGAKDVTDLTWKNLLDAYTCTECGRCTASCPANLTGKTLSPRKIMMDTRDRLEEVGRNIDQHGPDFVDNKQLLGDYISIEELRACTTCQACVEECPVNISPLEIIVQLRRALIMEDSNSPEEWNLMFTNIENNSAPWQFSQQDRDKWVHEMN